MKIFIVAALCGMAFAAPSPYGVPDNDPIIYVSPPVYPQPAPQPVYPQPKPQPPTQPAYPQPQPTYPQPQPSYPQLQPQPQVQPAYPLPQPINPLPPYPQPPTQPAKPQPHPVYPSKTVYPQEPSRPAETDYAPQPYNFEWEVEDKASSNNFEHSESSDGKVVSGFYKVNLPDGRRQIVTYRDDGNGLITDVKYEGEAVYPDNPKPSYPTNEYVTKKYDVTYPAQIYTPAPVYPPVPQLPYGIGY